MKVGKILKYHRKKQKLTQEELANQICSVPYLSKLENDKLESKTNMETLSLLCKRLYISLDDLSFYNLDDLHKDLFKWYEVMQNGDVKLSREYKKRYEKLFGEQREEMLNFETINFYNLFLLRHYLLTSEYGFADKQLEKLKDNELLLNDKQLYYYYKFSGLLLISKNELTKAEKNLEKSVDIGELIGLNEADTYFKLGILYSRLDKLIKSFYVLEKARELFSMEINFERVLDSMIALAINYNLIGEYEIAIKKFQEIEKRFHKSKMSSEKLAILYHNLGYTYYNKKSYHDASKYLHKALDIKETQGINRSYIKTYYLATLILIESEVGKRHNSNILNRLDEGMKLANKIKSKEYNLKFSLQKLKYCNENTSDIIYFIKNEALPYFRFKGDRDDYNFFLKAIGEFYYQEKRYKLASDYFYQSMRN